METPERTQYKATSLWVVGNQVEATVTPGLREDLHLSGEQMVAITPTLDDMAFQFAVSTDASGDRANERRLKGRDDSPSVTIRYPAVLAAATGFLQHVQNRSQSRLRFARDETETRRFTTWVAPPLRPEIAANAGQYLDVAPAEKRLFELPTAYGIELDNRFVNALGLTRGDPVAWRLSARNGRFALVGDFDPQSIDADAPNVRNVQVHQSGVEDALTDQYRLYLPKALVECLYWEDVKLRFQLERQRIVAQPAVGTREEFDAESLPVERLPGTESTPA